MNNQKYNYDFEIDEADVQRGGSSHTELLKMVTAGSTVLEIGSADGIMTKYLKQKLGCRISIIEIDSEAFSHAIEYADEGVCADIEKDKWVEQLPHIKYDYIIFADVLEHLRAPGKALSIAKELLKDTGAILLSVPNIAYGDIIMNLMCDQFQYTSVGLLDNTHIHFFAHKSLHDLIEQQDLKIVFETYTWVPLFHSEQGQFIPEEKRAQLEQSLSMHSNRNVYQFICKIEKGRPAQSETVKRIFYAQVPLRSNLYFDCGDGFSAANRAEFLNLPLVGGRAVFEVKLPEHCQYVRFDPVEIQKCILKETTAIVDDSHVELINLNGIRYGKWDFFCIEDPQLMVKIPNGAKALKIETQITILGNNGWREIFEMMTVGQNQIQQLKERLIRLEKQRDELSEWKPQAEAALEIKESQIKALNEWKQQAEAALEIKESQIKALNVWKQQAEAAIEIRDSQAIALNEWKQQAEAAIVSKDSQLQALNNVYNDCQDKLLQTQEGYETLLHLKEELINKCNSLETQVIAVRQSFSWKITKPLRFLRKLFM